MDDNVMKLIDTHAHIDVDRFDEDRDQVVARAREAGLVAIVNMGDTMESSLRSVKLTQQYDMLYAGVGIHPEEAKALVTQNEMDQLAKWTEMDKVIAIGEIGLDYYWCKDAELRELQRQVFIQQLDLAKQLHLPVCVHNRDAHGDTLEILKREAKGVRGVMHCFSGSLEMAKELLKLD